MLLVMLHRSSPTMQLVTELSLALLAVACSSPMHEAARPDASARATREATARQGDAPAEACPAAVAGSSVRVDDIAGGAAIEIMTNGDAATARARSRVMATHLGISTEDHFEMHSGEGPAAGAHSPAVICGEPGGGGLRASGATSVWSGSRQRPSTSKSARKSHSWSAADDETKSPPCVCTCVAWRRA